MGVAFWRRSAFSPGKRERKGICQVGEIVFNSKRCAVAKKLRLYRLCGGGLTST